MLKWIDIPPTWLAVAIAVCWLQSRYLSFDLSFGGTWAGLFGAVLVTLGLALILAAITQMLCLRTTPVPHRHASHLVTTGVFALSRNPIYLGDALILLGLVLRWDAVFSLLLVPALIWIIQKRFILDEESRLASKFRTEFEHYCSKTRRWI